MKIFQISGKEYREFLHDFYMQTKWPRLRLGQAFVNKYSLGPYPDLFYAESHEAQHIIENSHVNWQA